jgi:hypothetical protein
MAIRTFFVVAVNIRAAEGLIVLDMGMYAAFCRASIAK